VWRPGIGITRTGDATAETIAPVDEPEPESAPAAAPATRRRPDPSERGLRDLVGSGPSQVGPTRAMRARDANRPTEADLAEAEREVVLVRRHWKPPSGR
jgi:hypothetical protein